MFPKLIKKVSKTHIKLEQKFVGKKIELVIDRFRCVGCGICSMVCPKEAIFIGPAVAAYGFKKQSTEKPSSVKLINLPIETACLDVCEFYFDRDANLPYYICNSICF